MKNNKPQKEIKFSHNYHKLQEHGKLAQLIECLIIDRKNLHNEFIEYDTSYKKAGEELMDDIGYYPLPKSGKFLFLLFKSDKGLFTTIRAAYPLHKIDYYMKSIGKNFKIIIQKQ